MDLSRYGYGKKGKEREEEKKPTQNANANANANTKDSMYLLHSRRYITSHGFDNMHRWCNGDAEGALNNIMIHEIEE